MMPFRIVAWLVLLVLILPPVALGQNDTFAVVAPWVVAVFQSDGKQIHLGSGFVSSDGYVVTAAHVISSEKLPVFLATQGDLTPDRMRSARVVSIDRDSDIAILDGGYAPPVGLLSQQMPAETGDEVWVFGYEFLGSRSAILRIARGSIGQRFEDAYQLDAPIQHGFSGGPVTTRGGRVVGIISFGWRGGNPNLAYIVPDKPIQEKLSALPRKVPPTTSSSIIPPLPETRPSVPLIRDTVVVPGQRLGPLTLSSSLAQMNALLGGPPDSSSANSDNSQTYTWKKYGVMVSIDTNGTPIWLGTWNPAFYTAEGVRIGSSTDAVIRAYGLNYQTSWDKDNASSMIVYPSGINLIIDVKSDNVVAIAVNRVEPSAALPDQFRITPGIGIGSIKLGVPLSEAIARFGSPSSVETIGTHEVETFTNYVWQEVGHRFIVQTRATKPTEVFSVWILFDRRYETATGLHVGMTPTAVENIMGGPPTQVFNLVRTTMLVYTPQGIAFLIGNDSMAAEWYGVVYGIVVSHEFKVVF